MFKNPEKHTVIGIVKSSFEQARIGDEEDVLALASGEMNEGEETILRSFKPWVKPFADKQRSHIMILE